MNAILFIQIFGMYVSSLKCPLSLNPVSSPDDDTYELKADKTQSQAA